MTATKGQSAKLMLLIVLVGIAVILGQRAWREWQVVKESERLFVIADGQMDQRKNREALVTLDRILAINPIFYPAYEAKSDIYLWQHDNARALSTLESALPYLPDDPRLHCLLGRYYLKIAHDYTRARQELSRSCQLDPHDYTAAALLRQATAAEQAR